MRESTRLAGLASGQSIPCKAGDRRTVVVTRELTYQVSTRHGSGSQEVDTLTASFSTDRCASLVARAITSALRDGATDGQARAAAGEAVAEALAGEYRLRREYGPAYRDHDLLADLERALGIFPAADLDALAEALTGLAVAS